MRRARLQLQIHFVGHALKRMAQRVPAFLVADFRPNASRRRYDKVIFNLFKSA
jgi:hypothetical protein